MSEKYILLSGRPGSGKTAIIVAYANQHPDKTIILSQEYTKENAVKFHNLHERVTVVKSLNDIDIGKYDTIAIDYIELLCENEIKNLIQKLSLIDIRIIAVGQQRIGDFAIQNIFKKYLGN